jgi:hypothetical protein
VVEKTDSSRRNRLHGERRLSPLTAAGNRAIPRGSRPNNLAWSGLESVASDHATYSRLGVSARRSPLSCTARAGTPCALHCRVDVKLWCERNALERAALLCLLCALAVGLCHPNAAHAYTLKATKSGHPVRWSSPTITLYVDERLEHAYGKEAVASALSIAVDAWRGLPNVPDITISERPAPGYQADQRTNGVYFMSPWPFARQQLAVTVSTYDLEGRMIGADVLVNGDSEYALLADGADEPGQVKHDMAAVLTHEMGHVLGLDESPDDQGATMWPYIRGGDVHQRTLSDDDEQGVIAAYRGVTWEASNGNCAQASVIGSRPQSSSLLQLNVLLLAAFWVARRGARRGEERERVPARVEVALQSVRPSLAP